MSDAVRIVEVGPRDGLQNEKSPIGVADRIAFIEALIAAGLHTVEVGAFVSPKAIPQMVGSDQVLRGVRHIAGAEFHVLVPNEKGYEASQAAGAKVIAVLPRPRKDFRAPYAGVLKKLKCKVGDIVGEGVELAEVEKAS